MYLTVEGCGFGFHYTHAYSTLATTSADADGFLYSLWRKINKMQGLQTKKLPATASLEASQDFSSPRHLCGQKLVLSHSVGKQRSSESVKSLGTAFCRDRQKSNSNVVIHVIQALFSGCIHLHVEDYYLYFSQSLETRPELISKLHVSRLLTRIKSSYGELVLLL